MWRCTTHAVEVAGKVPAVSGRAKGRLRRLPPPDWLLFVDEDIWFVEWAMAMNWQDATEDWRSRWIGRTGRQGDVAGDEDDE
jgi:hypothetical protein